tara:strand:- start:455 stop:2479 length:2025 start_codon:yes stop_codon:yes gene_type:complete
MSKVNRRQAQKKIKDLTKDLNRHSRLYYLDDSPEISDAEYDRLFRELLDIESQFPDLCLNDSPTLRVGASPENGFDTVRRQIPMLSLDNAKNADEMRSFDERIRRNLDRDHSIVLMGEPKLDGAGVELIYVEGSFEIGSTRGDGRVGENVTSNLINILSIPLVLDGPAPSRLAVRGEVILPLRAFDRLNSIREKKGKDAFVNPRNAAAGALRMLNDIDRDRLRSLEFHAYGLGEGLPEQIVDQQGLLEQLALWGFKTSPGYALCKNVEEAIQYHKAREKERGELGYEIDGSVFKVNEFRLQRDLGELSRMPRWAIAFKFQPQQETTIVEDIFVSVGRTGALTPVARLRPIFVGGVTISNASLHNQDEIDRKDIRIGDTVVVQRAGDVIPQIVSVLKAKREKGTTRYKLPTSCPSCGSDVVRSDEEAVVRCVNIECSAQLKNNILHLAGRAALDIEGLGEKLVDQLISKGLVAKLSDVFALDVDALEGLPRMGRKSAGNLFASLSRSKKTTFARFISSLGISDVGEGVAQILANKFEDLSLLIDADLDSLIQIDGIGRTIAESVRNFFRNPRNLKEVEKLRELGIQWEEGVETQKSPKKQTLKGQIFVLTGSFDGISRNELKVFIEERGGKVTSSVSKKTDFLVAGDSPGQKLKKSEELGIRVIGQEALLLLADP